MRLLDSGQECKAISVGFGRRHLEAGDPATAAKFPQGHLHNLRHTHAGFGRQRSRQGAGFIGPNIQLFAGASRHGQGASNAGWAEAGENANC